MFARMISLFGVKTSCLAVSVIVLTSACAGAADHLPLYRFYNTKIHQHEYTNSETEAKEWQKVPHKNKEKVLGWLPTGPGKEVTRLYRATKENGRHYYYTVKPRGFKNFKLEPTNMYVYEHKGNGRVAVHATCLSGGEDMFFSTSKEELDLVIEDTKNAIGNQRRRFLNVFYVLEEKPEE
ncbi:MAG: hypothetical protein HUJ26_22145 [Planctomycetaceae bacterium]|nr:hypothetical protein [Planctomycetaceae bacterium]